MPDPRLSIADAEPRAPGRAHNRIARAARALLPATLALLAGCAGLPFGQAAEDDTNAPSAETLAHEAAQQRLHAAVQASQPGEARLATARHALEKLLGDERAEARTLHPYARALLEQIRERQRLAVLAERLRRQLDDGIPAAEARERELDALHRQNAELQRKLDALAEIEHRLSPPSLPLQPRTGQPE